MLFGVAPLPRPKLYECRSGRSHFERTGAAPAGR